MSDLPMLASLDDHVVEPPHVWERWLPRDHRDAGPRVERRRVGELRYQHGSYRHDLDPDDGSGEWCDVWRFGDVVRPLERQVAAAGFACDEMTFEPVTYDDVRPGCYEPGARVEDLNENRVDMSVAFPTFAGSCGQTFLHTADRDLALACVRAYNDWMIEEWCDGSGGVLVPSIIVPLWDPALAAAEVRYNAARGSRVASFCDIPARLGLPSIHSTDWEPFLEACDETRTAVLVHVGSAGETEPEPVAAGGETGPPGLDPAMVSLSDWLFSGILPRHPDLRIVFSLGRIAWVSHVLERADVVWEKQREAPVGTRRRVPEPPSTYWARQGSVCLRRDHRGAERLDRIGVDNVVVSTDYPRLHTTWPETTLVIDELVADLDDTSMRKICRRNAIKLLA